MTASPSDITELQSLVRQLRAVPKVIELGRSLGPNGIDEIATEAATGLIDVRGAGDRIRLLLPRLLQLQPTEPGFEEVLYGIAEEYRHIYYHIRHTRLFDYVVPDL